MRRRRAVLAAVTVVIIYYLFSGSSDSQEAPLAVAETRRQVSVRPIDNAAGLQSAPKDDKLGEAIVAAAVAAEIDAARDASGASDGAPEAPAAAVNSPGDSNSDEPPPARTASSSELKLTDLTLDVEGKPFHVVRGQSNPSPPYVFILVHGGSKDSQNAAYWTPHYKFFGAYGIFYAIDLLGHGKSQTRESVGRSTHINTIRAVVDSLSPAEATLEIVIVARSMGGGLTLDLVKDQPDIARRLILIAPAGDPGMGLSAIKIKTLLYWNKRDPVVPFTKAHGLMKQFAAIELASPPGEGSHTPENDDPLDFQTAVVTFLNKEEIGKKKKKPAAKKTKL